MPSMSVVAGALGFIAFLELTFTPGEVKVLGWKDDTDPLHRSS
jgi:hypothetical protein